MNSPLAVASAFALALPLVAPSPRAQVEQASLPVLTALLEPQEVAEASAPEPVLPLPSGPLVIGAGRANLSELVAQISQLTGVSIRASASALGRLAESPTGLLADTQIAPEAAWSFFESLISQEGFLMVELRASSPRLLAIIDNYNGQSRNGPRHYRAIPGERLDDYAEHHALLIETVLHLEYVDVRQLSNSLRSLVTDQSSLNMVPAGTSGSLLVQGTGANLAELARMLRTVDTAEKARFARVGESGDTAPTDGTTNG
ncbi:secretin N-terminal domain-containing protein [Engelhardtia mirabilis]|uniref:NolW-like domain-containing protein n=1 Tax=Engelhardtia mirabilis TaxID=2528011 RepID=A0A518BHR4_9BACT|nr:hypothetical protein Pla133_15800 [Planctomycetes bacterium Pla133]QDV00832.1 hypothetical protein Pla86_15790 [Planctomycetes bacterium Pla86]